MHDNIIVAENLGFSIPVFQPAERKINRNPLRLMTDFYSNQSERNMRSLISDVNFKLKYGQRLGVMGGNGGGKNHAT